MTDRNKEQILREIAYESTEGEHTYTICKCGRASSRSYKCLMCLNEELRDLNFKDLDKKYPTNSKGVKQDWTRVASTRHLTRIIVYLSNVECAAKTKISGEACIADGKLDDALIFLVNHKILYKTLKRINLSITQYALNPLFKQK